MHDSRRADSAGRSSHAQRIRARLVVTAIQLALLAAFLAAWEWLPTIGWLSQRSHLFDRFFISSPIQIADRLYGMAFGAENATPLWLYTWHTTSAALMGLIIGMVFGGLFGLLLGSSVRWSSILRPFLVAINATPRIALIPIVVLLFGPTLKGSVMVSVMVTFFIAFFNAYEGARTVSPILIQNATVLGANRRQIMIHIRLPFVVAWTLAALPLAATFSVISVVTGELLIGYTGLGRLLDLATAASDATLTFAVIVILSVLGLVTVLVADFISRHFLHWWGK